MYSYENHILAVRLYMELDRRLATKHMSIASCAYIHKVHGQSYLINWLQALISHGVRCFYAL